MKNRVPPIKAEDPREDSMGKLHAPSPLIYFYSGTTLPSYARHSINYAARTWAGPVIFLTDTNPKKLAPRIKVENFTDWFKSNQYDSFLSKSPLDHGFREGFWLKTAMRFFVLHQYMVSSNLDRFFHLEVDVLAFDLTGVPQILDRAGSGVFVPSLAEDHAIASLIYCNSSDKLGQLVSHFQKKAYLGNEMKILASFRGEDSGLVTGLPSSSTVARAIQGKPLLAGELGLSEELGIFDAAPLGQWIFGNDPRNQPGTLVRNHFVFPYDQDSNTDMKALSPKFFFRGTQLLLRTAVGNYPVRCLHIHSKTLRVAKDRFLFIISVFFANLETQSPVMVRSLLGRSIIKKMAGHRGALDKILIRVKKWVLHFGRF